MGLPPPKLRDLAAWIRDENPRIERNLRKVWEIGVPAKKSLSWSIVLSVLFTESNESFSDRLEKLTGDESEVKEIRGKKNLRSAKINQAVIRQKLDSFNPFKNRHNFFHWLEVSEVVRIFDLRLKRYANKKKSRTELWNDDLKLKAASSFLGCRINVYFPHGIETGKFTTYPETPGKCSLNIDIFQYENQQHGAREDPINIFNFAMELKQAHKLKIDALRHFLKKTKSDDFIMNKVIRLMNRPEAHGTAFLPTIMENNCFDILLEIYQSPYIAFKLSEAGFETDPIERISGKPSPLCYALTCSTNPEYLRILYDYASNCRCLFDRSVRRADHTILESLKRIIRELELDISEVKKCNFEKGSTERAVHILKQICRFVEYQLKIVSDLKNLKEKFENKAIKTFEFRKEIIESIIGCYLIYFRYDEAKAGDISQQLTDFLSFTEYYDYTDSFFYISFFDNFYKLKFCFGLGEENLLLDVEWKMFLAMVSNKYFPKFVPKNTYEVEINTIESEKSKDFLRHIPLHHRNVVESEVNSLFNLLKDTLTSEDQQVRRDLKSSFHSLSHVIDELVIARLNKYIGAVQEVSFANDGMRAVMVIERAMQVIGESIKPPSSMDSFVSFLLRSRLSLSLQEELIHIRNDLSKYRSNSVYGKLTVEKDSKVFEGIKSEIKQIQEAFEIVSLTQYLRTEESVMCDCLDRLKDNLESNAYEEFKREYEIRLQQRRHEYVKNHRKCIDLLLDSFSDLLEHSKKIDLAVKPFRLQNILVGLLGQLKSIEYLLEFITKNKIEKYLKNLLFEVQNFFQINKDKHDKEIEELISSEDQLKKMKDEGKILNEMIIGNKKMEALVKQLLSDLVRDLGTFLPKCKDEILKNNSKEDATISTPNIQSFFKSLKQNMFSSEEIKEISSVVEIALKEAVDAKRELEDLFKNNSFESNHKVKELLKKILIPNDKLADVVSCYENRNSIEAMKYLKKSISEEPIKKDLINMLTKGSLASGYACTILTKIVFQNYSNSKFYTSPRLTDKTHKKLEDFLIKKVNVLLNRLEILKNVLIEEDEEILATWKWGRSAAIKYHLKFLMRQRYRRERTVCASLEMAYFDCINIFHEPLQRCVEDGHDGADSSNSLATLYEKSTDLFAGIDLRNIVSHRSNIPEAIGDILDEEDFPSEMIEKILELIDDTEAIKALLELFKKSGALAEKDFVEGITKSKFHENFPKLTDTVTGCGRWEKYLSLLPFIKT